MNSHSRLYRRNRYFHPLRFSVALTACAELEVRAGGTVTLASRASSPLTLDYASEKFLLRPLPTQFEFDRPHLQEIIVFCSEQLHAEVESILDGALLSSEEAGLSEESWEGLSDPFVEGSAYFER